MRPFPEDKIENGPGTPYAVTRPGMGGLLGSCPELDPSDRAFGTCAQKHRTLRGVDSCRVFSGIPVALALGKAADLFSWGSIAVRTSGAASRPPGAVVQLAWVVTPCSPALVHRATGTAEALRSDHLRVWGTIVFHRFNRLLRINPDHRENARRDRRDDTRPDSGPVALSSAPAGRGNCVPGHSVRTLASPMRWRAGAAFSQGWAQHEPNNGCKREGSPPPNRFGSGLQLARC